MSLEKTVHINQLLSYYGTLLTEKQQTMMASYYEEDLSLSEIGENYQISRQAVYDNLKRAESLLKEYEEKLKLLEKSNQRLKRYEQLKQVLTKNQQAVEMVEDLIQKEL